MDEHPRPDPLPRSVIDAEAHRDGEANTRASTSEPRPKPRPRQQAVRQRHWFVTLALLQVALILLALQTITYQL